MCRHVVFEVEIQQPLPHAPMQPHSPSQNSGRSDTSALASAPNKPCAQPPAPRQSASAPHHEGTTHISLRNMLY
jgi:hypothetical protein